MPAVPLPDPSLLAKLEAFRLAVKSVRWGSRLGGPFPINRRGFSGEFADYAAYSPGDDIRAIDWNLYGRTDRLFVKTYREEVELSVEILVDATASMTLPSPLKFERAVQVGLCLAYVALAAHHQVRLSWMTSGRPRATRWFIRPAELPELLGTASGIVPGGMVELDVWVRQALATLHMRGGQCLLVSDGMIPAASFLRAMHQLLMQHLEVKVFQVLSPEELHPSRWFRAGQVVDSETGATHELAYSTVELEQAVREHNEQLARAGLRHGIPVVQHRLDESLEQFFLKTLPARGFLEPVG